MIPLAPAAVYLLCVVTSLVCVWLLVRAYLRTRLALMLWTAISFGFLAANNMLLFADLVIFPGVDLLTFRQATLLCAIGALLYGFLQEV